LVVFFFVLMGTSVEAARPAENTEVFEPRGVVLASACWGV